MLLDLQTSPGKAITKIRSRCCRIYGLASRKKVTLSAIDGGFAGVSGGLDICWGFVVCYQNGSVAGFKRMLQPLYVIRPANGNHIETHRQGHLITLQVMSGGLNDFLLLALINAVQCTAKLL